MCSGCKNRNECPYTESFNLLCMPLINSINDGLNEENIFTMELKCNYRDKELPYKIEVDNALNVELDKILKEC